MWRKLNAPVPRTITALGLLRTVPIFLTAVSIWMNSHLICALLFAWILVRIHLRHTWYWSLQGVKLESTPHVVEQAARPEESNNPDLSCSLALSPSERVKGKCFPPSCAQPPIPPLSFLYQHIIARNPITQSPYPQSTQYHRPRNPMCRINYPLILPTMNSSVTSWYILACLSRKIKGA